MHDDRAQSCYARVDACWRSEEDELRARLPFVQQVARFLHGRLAPAGLDDLVQAGLVGVLRLLRRDPLRAKIDGVVWRAAADAMVDEARRVRGGPVRLSTELVAAKRALARAEAKRGPGVSDEEVAAEMGISVERFRKILRASNSLPVFVSQTEDVADSKGVETETREELLTQLTFAVKSLGKQEQMVLSLYYEQQMSMAEVGEVLGLSEGRIGQIHGHAVLRLRRLLRTSRR